MQLSFTQRKLQFTVTFEDLKWYCSQCDSCEYPSAQILPPS